MVQILERPPSFGEILGKGLGGGIGQGISRSADFASQMQMEKSKTEQRQKMIEALRGKQSAPQEDIREKFLEALPQIEQHIGRDLTPDDLDKLWSFANKGNQSSQEQQGDPYEMAENFSIAGEPELARIATQRAKSKEKIRAEQSSRHFEIAKKTLQNVAQKAEILPQKEMALGELENAITENNLGFFSGDNLAELTGIEALRSPEGAAFKTASKEFFIGNLGRVGAKGLNQWLERQINDMSPKIGRSTEANLVVTEMLKADIDVEKKQVELTNRIAEEMEQKYGHVRRDLSEQVMKELQPYAVEKQKELKEKVQSIRDRFTPMNENGHLMKDPAGNLRRVSKKDFKAATQAGYKVEK